MPKVGNYVQRDYHNRFKSQRKKTWSDYNQGWASKRSNAAAKADQLRQVAATYNNITSQAIQQLTYMSVSNGSTGNPYASPTAVMARVNKLI